MAKFYTESGLKAIKGTLGGNVFYSRYGRNMVRSLAKEVENPITARQTEIRANLARLFQLFQTLTDEQKALWKVWIGQQPKPPDYAQRGSEFWKPVYNDMSVLNGFVAVNQRLFLFDYDPVMLPPTIVYPQPTMTIQWNETTKKLIITAVWAADDIPDGTKIKFGVKGQRTKTASSIIFMGASTEVTASSGSPTTASLEVTTFRLGHRQEIADVPLDYLRLTTLKIQGIGMDSKGNYSTVTEYQYFQIPAAPTP